MTRYRKLNISKKPFTCPRCDCNDKVDILYAQLKNWFRYNTTHTENHIQDASHWCERWYIIFKIEVGEEWK